MWAMRKNSGFTIVELLIVVVVIGILAAIVTVAYSGITQSANASAVADGLRKFEKAMQLHVTASGNYSSWPIDSALTGGANPNIASLIASSPGFSNYMQQPIDVAGISPSKWRYDNDGDTYDGCSINYGLGVNVYITGVTDTDLAQRVDAILDDGNTSCGELRLIGTSLILSISRNSTF